MRLISISLTLLSVLYLGDYIGEYYFKGSLKSDSGYWDCIEKFEQNRTNCTIEVIRMDDYRPCLNFSNNDIKLLHASYKDLDQICHLVNVTIIYPSNNQTQKYYLKLSNYQSYLIGDHTCYWDGKNCPKLVNNCIRGFNYQNLGFVFLILLTIFSWQKTFQLEAN